MLHGLLVVDKPLGMTSRAALDRAARWFPPGTKIGHAGTLDPLATGVLVLCIGHATRLTGYIHAMTKAYESEFTLGATSATDDAEGPIESIANAVAPDRSAIERACLRLTGAIEQAPPAYSAAKTAGRRAYAAARRGETVTLTPRTVRVERIEILDYAFPTLRVRIECGKGTYIRSLARDLGAILGCGAYVSTLRRTRIGTWTGESACPLDSDPGDALERVLPPIRALAALPVITVGRDDAERFRHGRRIARINRSDDGPTAVMDESGELIGVGRPVGDEIQPDCVLPPR